MVEFACFRSGVEYLSKMFVLAPHLSVTGFTGTANGIEVKDKQPQSVVGVEIDGELLR